MIQPTRAEIFRPTELKDLDCSRLKTPQDIIVLVKCQVSLLCKMLSWSFPWNSPIKQTLRNYYINQSCFRFLSEKLLYAELSCFCQQTSDLPHKNTDVTFERLCWLTENFCYNSSFILPPRQIKSTVWLCGRIKNRRRQIQTFDQNNN